METRNDTDGKDKTGRTETVGTFSFIYLGVPQRFAFQLSLFVTWKSLAGFYYIVLGHRSTLRYFRSLRSLFFCSTVSLRLFFSLRICCFSDIVYRVLQVSVILIAPVLVTDSDSRYRCSSFKVTKSFLNGPC